MTPQGALNPLHRTLWTVSVFAACVFLLRLLGVRAATGGDRPEESTTTADSGRRRREDVNTQSDAIGQSILQIRSNCSCAFLLNGSAKLPSLRPSSSGSLDQSLQVVEHLYTLKHVETAHRSDGGLKMNNAVLLCKQSTIIYTQNSAWGCAFHACACFGVNL